MLSKISSHIQPRHLGLAGMVALAWAFMSLFRYDNYGLEEGATQALLINWSIVHQIVSPAALFGLPDLRAIVFVPLNIYWAGSLPAAKVYTMFVLFGTALMLYRWNESRYSSEAAMISSALLLLAPISLMQTDALGSGIYLLFSFAVIGWLKQLLDDSDHSLPSWYFLMILITALAISMHPMGLAIPIVLLAKWWHQADKRKQGMSLAIGISITTIIILLLRWGWSGMEAAAGNPLHVLTDILLGSELLHEPGWITGVIIIDLLLAAMIVQLYRKQLDTLSLILIAASLIGTLHADHAWALVAWATTLYLGTPLLIELNERFGWRGLSGQRGLVLTTAIIIATVSMVHDRQTLIIAKQHLKSPTDTVIAVLEREASNTQVKFLAASQWPARTLLACRRDVLPLPPASEDLAQFRKTVSPLTHIAFDPKTDGLRQLARNAAGMSHELETISLTPGGVVLKAKQVSGK